ncbi:tetratricopeptide repeat protein [Roseimaritima ulvae]|uniref:Lipoprotein NlpI n=1 Tax=Roseimaritima ulvae TaxID=980254 RepID=A0A5B9QP47_9BACT|nr:tetratricopeptide repeat protein [Roseimaritima ulvae]QEG40867.1 lipoprotein NlpI [Roseimaritima ulvae]
MKNTLLTWLMLLCLTGCSGLPGFKRSADPAGRSQPKATVGAQTSLADPSHQELAIAWETAQLAEQRGMDKEAIAAYLEVRRHDPDRPRVAHALAVLYDRSGMTDAASREYRAALEESPDDANVHCDYGYFLYSTGDSPAAESSLREALRLQPEHQQAMINLALVVGSSGRYDEAQALFTEAIGPAAALHNVGMLRLRAGDVETAKRLLAEAQRRDPSISQAEAVLARLSPPTP